jgi:hypothetical protein
MKVYLDGGMIVNSGVEVVHELLREYNRLFRSGDPVGATLMLERVLLALRRR